MKKFVLFLFGLVFLASASSWAQDATVTGTVTDDKGSPIAGVSIAVKGSNRGTTSDTEGKYSIGAASDATLVFSFIGFKSQEIAVGNQTDIGIELEADVSQLSEVVVTALGIERKRNELAYAAQQVSNEQLVKTRNNNFVNALAGKVAGLDIKTNNNMGGSTSTIIRGYKSITGNNQALFVIDGIPVTNANTNSSGQQMGMRGTDYGNAASDISSDNIESINVLKGAAATALYGARASNGVVMITTKKGRKNSFDVNVNSGLTWGTIDRSTFVKYQKEYGAGYGSDFYEGDLGDGEGPIAQFDADASFGSKFDPSLMVYQWDAIDPSSPTYQQRTPWVAAQNGPDKYYETAMNSNQSISITGGGDNTSFQIGYTRNDEKGVLPNSKLTKNLFTFGSTFDLSEKLSFSANANFSQIGGVGRYGTGYDGKNPNQQYRQWFQTNVDLLEQKAAYFRNKQNVTWNWALPDAPFADNYAIYSDNPYFSRYENYDNDTRNNFFGHASATYKIADWIDVVARYAYNGTTDVQEERLAVGSSGVPFYTRYNRDFNETNLDFIVNFRKSFGENFGIRGLVGSNMRRSKLNSIFASTNGGLVVPKLYSISNSVSPINPNSEGFQRIGVDGLFANVSFNYKELLFLDLAGRRDRSTTLPLDNNTYFYPSVGVNFAFSNLESLKAPWLTHGKIRANYAEVGSDAPALSIYDIYRKPTGFGNIPLFSMPTTKNNSALLPERTKSVEAGIEAELFGGRVGFDFTWYKTNTLNQIIPVSVSSATGFLNRFVNAGEMQNQGIEVSLNLEPVRSDNFTWKMGINFTRNRNKVLSLYATEQDTVENIVIAGLQGGVSINAALNHPFGVIRGTDFVYVDGQKEINSSGYYQSSSSSAQVIGNPNPDWLGGISNTLSYRNVALSFLVDIRSGGQLFSLDQYYGQGTGMYPNTAGLNELGNPSRDPAYDEDGNLLPKPGGVLFEGVNVTRDEEGNVQSVVPNTIRGENVDGSGATAFGYASAPAMPRALYVYDASYVKLREASLTYSLPASWISRLKGFKGIDVSLIGRNLWIIHKNTPYTDPEEGLSSGINSGAGGYQSGAYPAVRNYGFNVRLHL